jgi:carbonic anhydrase
LRQADGPGARSRGITVGTEHYDFVQFQFPHPREEAMKGYHCAMVAHLVHMNTRGYLAVVAMMIRRGETNKFLKSAFDNFPAKGQQESSSVR